MHARRWHPKTDRLDTLPAIQKRKRSFISMQHVSRDTGTWSYTTRKGGHDGAPEFVAGIPDDWNEENVIDLILRPLEDVNAQYPAWEVPACVYNCETLFRWWAGEKPKR